jgi:hypothetical protein
MIPIITYQEVSAREPYFQVLLEKVRLITARNCQQDLQFNDSITNGIPHQAGKRIQIELRKNPCAMELHRLYADVQNG